MTLPLPFKLADDDDPIQANFDAIKKQFPLSRQHMKIEPPREVGASGQPPFQNSWVNFDPVGWEVARFWKDPMDMVHIEGLVKSGATATVVFTLPAGYRPRRGLVAGSDMNANTHARIDIAATGEVLVRFGTGGTNVYVSLFIPPFRQEQ